VTELLLFVAGLLIAAVFSMVGLAGGTFIVPMLVLGFGLATQKAIGISLFAVTFITISATFGYALRRRIHFKLGLLLDTLDVPGAFVGAYLTTLLNSNILAGMFGASLLLTSFYMFVKKRNSGKGKEFLKLDSRVVLACMVGSFLGGAVSGMFGIGGGTVDEVVMLLILGMAVHLSAGTAIFGMAITTVAALVPHWMLGNVILEYAVPLAVGGAIGGQIGPYFSGRAQARTLRRIMVAVIALIGARMLLVPVL